MITLESINKSESFNLLSIDNANSSPRKKFPTTHNYYSEYADRYRAISEPYANGKVFSIFTLVSLGWANFAYLTLVVLAGFCTLFFPQKINPWNNNRSPYGIHRVAKLIRPSHCCELDHDNSFIQINSQPCNKLKWTSGPFYQLFCCCWDVTRPHLCTGKHNW